MRKAVCLSTYKGAFLYALSDIRFYNDEELVGKEWIHPEGKQTKINLDFIAIRFARYYWEVIDTGIRHVPKKMADEKNPERDVNIVGLIQEIRKKIQSGHIPSLQELSSGDMAEFRKDIITKSFKEPLDHLFPIFLGLFENDKKRTIRIDSDLMDFMKNNNEYIRTQIGIKTQKHLDKINSKTKMKDISISMDNPFYKYIRKHTPALFLICVENTESKDNYDKTVKKKITLDIPDMSKPVSVWGLRSTDENIETWKQIQENDIILFSQDNRCFSKCYVQTTIQNKNLAKQLWADANEGTTRDLLIIFYDIKPFYLNLKTSHTRLIDPTMPKEYNFPIIRIDEKKIDYLFLAYGGIDVALNNISEKYLDTTLPTNVLVVLEKGESMRRKGQDRFRDMVLENYHEKCAICNISEKALLEASHIITVKNFDTAGAIDNGICLCILHHKMFDKGYLSFNNEYKVILTDKVISKHLQNSCINDRITELTCKKLPSKKYLRAHRMNLGLESI